MKSASKKPFILCFLDVDRGRDAEIILPLVYFAENVLGCRVDFSFIWNIHDIYRKKPDLVLIANTIGSKLHHDLTKYAHEHGIKVFALISEGNFRTDGSFDYYGYNTDRVFYQEYLCHWSERTKEFFDREIPSLGERNVFTGATGFDRYVIYEFEKKNDFLKRYRLSGFKRVIGYAGWAFGKMYNPQGREELKPYLQNFEDGFRWLEDQMKEVEHILREAILAYPDILFLLKRHPNEANPTITKENPNEMIGLRDYPNVLYITGNENLHDLINVCDIWTAFESTTAIEAWLMGKETVFLNPDVHFNRDKTFLGTPIAKDAESFKSYIDEYYSKGNITAFYTNELKENRTEILKNTIGSDDGMNHMRAGYYLEKALKDIEPGEGKSRKITFKFKFWFMRFLLVTGSFLYIKKLFLILPKFKKTVWMFDTWKLRNLSLLQKRYGPYMKSFYRKNKISEKYSEGRLWESLGGSDFISSRNPNSKDL